MVSSDELSFGDAHITSVPVNAVDVFTPTPPSSIPTDIQLALYDDDSIGDEFASDQYKCFDRDNPVTLASQAPNVPADPYESDDDMSIDDDVGNVSLRGNIDTGTMVSCTNQQDALWNY